MTPLHYAIQSKRKEMALELINQNVSLEPALLHVAIEKGVNLQALYRGMTPLQHAQSRGSQTDIAHTIASHQSSSIMQILTNPVVQLANYLPSFSTQTEVHTERSLERAERDRTHRP